MQIGSEVERLSGEKYQVGARGTMVEASGDRVRVYWHTNPSPTTKPKRTWVNVRVVRTLATAAQCSKCDPPGAVGLCLRPLNCAGLKDA
jgi:hypothetical protein